MTHEQFEVLSNQAVAACAVVYFLALLAHLAEWAAGRNAPVEQAAPVAVGGGGAEEPAATEPVDESAPELRRQMFGRVGLGLTMLAAAVHFVAVVARGLAPDPIRVPWGNMYEFTLTGTWVVVIGYLLLYRRYSLSWLSPVVTGFALVTLMIDVLVLYTPVVPLRDALQSPWLVIHVVAAIIATGAFTLGGMCSALYLVKERRASRPERRGGYLDRLPDLAVLDRVAYRTHAFAFPIWTFAALIAGPIWAHYAWGRYWGWDPKEVWAFITWVVYAAYLHARATQGWKGRSAAVVALVGLATLWFNFVGINFFFGSGSQHSYAAPQPTSVVQVVGEGPSPLRR
ncbi:MAG TPA: c-type cytochrome biogenesis protein CcsB [Marmoricola sp.]|nr:c-type cytochrome biogenesis protein CcsB [Marmoricola sp.]